MAYGSLVNHLSGGQTKAPEVGDGVTFLYWTDRKPGTIIEVSKSGRVITVQEDTATRIDSNGMSDAQSYEYSPNPEGAVSKYSKRKDGRWKAVGGTSEIAVGYRDKYHDYSF